MGSKKKKKGRKTEPHVIEFLARGVLVKQGHLLVCRNRKKKNIFLPGGHVELREGAKEALRREIDEEMGIDCKVGLFLGACEHTFVYRDRRVCEINLVFAMSNPGLRPPKPGPSQEKNLEFVWIPLRRVKNSRLEPRSLRRDLAAWLRRRPRGSNWSSGY